MNVDRPPTRTELVEGCRGLCYTCRQGTHSDALARGRTDSQECRKVHRPESLLDDELERSLTELVVLSLLRRGPPGGLPSEELTSGECGRAADALAAALESLVAGGWLRPVSADGPPGEARAYSLTPAGERALAQAAAIWARCRGQLGPSTVDTTEHVFDLPTMAPSAEPERVSLEIERRRLDRLQNDLLSTVSHELRTPLTLIRTSVGLLMEGKPDKPMRERLLRNIKQSADRMHLLVTDLLDLVRLRSGKSELQLRYIDVAELVDGAASLMKALLDEKRQSLEIRLPERLSPIMGDSRRLEQVLLNLLSNAHKFSPEGARVRVSAVEEARTVTLAVSDTGPGISAEAQTHLFEQFYTARTSSPSHNIGAGLGLPIAKSIIENHGGRIWVESQVGAGATFYFSLPKEGPEGGR